MKSWILGFIALAVLALTAFATVQPLLAQTVPAIVDPPNPPALKNIFTDIAPGTHIRRDLLLGGGGKVTGAVIQKNGYLNRSAYGPYAIGDDVDSLAIGFTKGPVTGIALGGDNDCRQGDPSPVWTFYLADSSTVKWTLPCSKDEWREFHFKNVVAVHIEFFGHSQFLTLLVGVSDTSTATPTATGAVTPGVTPTATPTATPTGIVTPGVTPSDTPTPTVTPTATPSPTPTLSDTDRSTALERVDEPLVVARLWLPKVSR
jgi:hypothetical protein